MGVTNENYFIRKHIWKKYYFMSAHHLVSRRPEVLAIQRHLQFYVHQLVEERLLHTE
jgi:hypothetical protein